MQLLMTCQTKLSYLKKLLIIITITITIIIIGDYYLLGLFISMIYINDLYQWFNNLLFLMFYNL